MKNKSKTFACFLPSFFFLSFFHPIKLKLFSHHLSSRRPSLIFFLKINNRTTREKWDKVRNKIEKRIQNHHIIVFLIIYQT